MNDPGLSFLEARIIGVLIEKQHLTPDAYPLTLNSLTTGCNQKSAREPVVSVSESEVQEALEQLRSRLLVLETYGASGRVLRYAQNFARVYRVPPPSVALLAVLVLRGPQTVSELRANSERLYHFDDAPSVEGYLDELATRPAGALISRLPKQAGSREQRWIHLLCGPLAAAEPPTPIADDGHGSALEQRVSRLESEIAELRAAIALLTRDDPRT